MATPTRTVRSWRRARLLIAVPALALSTTLTTLAGSAPASGQVTGADAFHSRVRTELAVFTNWLRANGALGYVGEVGWPNNVDTAQWNALAQAWYADAAAANLLVSHWSAGEWWGPDYKLSSYVGQSYGALSGTRPPASVVEAQTAERRTVNVNGADFGPIGTGLSPTSTLSNMNPGVYGNAYQYDSQQSFSYLASRGIRTVRLAFRWERIQPTLNAPLDATELGRLAAAVGRARAAGMTVILNPQNYGAYWMFDGTQGVRRAIGSPEVPISAFADLWSRLSQHFRYDAGVTGYGLINEPVGMPAAPGLTPAQTWEQASQQAVNAIRSTGDTKTVMVPGYQWSGVSNWSTHHPRGWISDPAGNFRYEAHHYFDRDNSGAYSYSYAQEVADAQSRGYTAGPTVTTTPTTVAPTTSTTKAPTTTTTTVPAPTTTTTRPVSTTTTVVSGDSVAPSVPTGLYANGARRKVLLAWYAATDSGGSGIAGYEVWRATSAAGPFVRIAMPATVSYSDSAVTSRAPYWYKVIAFDKAGNRSAASAVVSAVPN
jgi:aryl-phospho-beta-D-glucosidase BglC (GH1 family)